MNIELIRLRNVKKSFIPSPPIFGITKKSQFGFSDTPQKKPFVNVLNGVSFAFKKGISYAIMGVSGAGKSTLLHILAGLDCPTSGTVYYNDLAYETLSPLCHEKLRNSSIGVIFQEPYLIDELAVLENVAIKGIIGGFLYKQSMKEACELMHNVGLWHLKDHHPSELSGGQQQRVSIARALLHQPDFIIADEPTANVDKKTAHEIVDILLYLHTHYAIGLIISTHDQAIASRMDINLQLSSGNLVIPSNKIPYYGKEHEL